MLKVRRWLVADQALLASHSLGVVDGIAAHEPQGHLGVVVDGGPP
jgi:hypothetical protein